MFGRAFHARVHGKRNKRAYLVHTHACMMSIDIDTNPLIISSGDCLINQLALFTFPVLGPLFYAVGLQANR
jgi:hypothetical protein